MIYPAPCPKCARPLHWTAGHRGRIYYRCAPCLTETSLPDFLALMSPEERAYEAEHEAALRSIGNDLDGRFDEGGYQ